jgi:hypothetical protein
MQVLMLRLLGRAQEANLVVSAIECEEALRLTNGSLDDAFAMIQRSRGLDLVSIDLLMEGWIIRESNTNSCSFLTPHSTITRRMCGN